MRLSSVLIVGLFVSASFGEEPKESKKDWYAKVVKSVEVEFIPAEAKPGETVTCKLTVKLEPGYHTYPLKQSDKRAESMINKWIFPEPASLIFVGDARDPDGGKTKSEPEIGITEMRYFTEKVVYQRKVVVSPAAKAGNATTKLTFKLSVCDADNCFPPKSLDLEGTVKVLDGPAVPVEKAYLDEVNRVLKK